MKLCRVIHENWGESIATFTETPSNISRTYSSNFNRSTECADSSTIFQLCCHWNCCHQWWSESCATVWFLWGLECIHSPTMGSSWVVLNVMFPVKSRTLLCTWIPPPQIQSDSDKLLMNAMLSLFWLSCFWE